jgi:hypothetical protein
VVGVTGTIDRSPSRFGLLLAAAATMTALAALLFVSPTATLVTLFGSFVLAAGVELDRVTVRDLGVVVMMGGPVAGGLVSQTASPLLLAAVAIVVARDAADNAVDLGAQLGARTRTRRAEAVHAAGTMLVGIGAALVGYIAFQVAGGGKPVTAVVVLLVGAVVLTLALRE